MHTMLYRYPGPHAIHGDQFDYIIVEDSKVEETLKQGWYLTTPEAKEGVDRLEPSRAELEQKATELGIKVDGRWSDKKLGELIAAKL